MNLKEVKLSVIYIYLSIENFHKELKSLTLVDNTNRYRNFSLKLFQYNKKYRNTSWLFYKREFNVFRDNVLKFCFDVKWSIEPDILKRIKIYNIINYGWIVSIVEFMFVVKKMSEWLIIFIIRLLSVV